MSDYSPQTQAILDAVAAGDVCPDCGAANHLRHFDECPRHPENQEAAEVPSPRLPMLAVVERLTAIAGDARRDAGVARADDDQERRQYLLGEHRGLMEAAEVLLAFDWTAAWREAMTIRAREQLDALPGNCVVRGADGHIVERRFVALPALLLWHPDWEGQS